MNLSNILDQRVDIWFVMLNIEYAHTNIKLLVQCNIVVYNALLSQYLFLMLSY